MNIVQLVETLQIGGLERLAVDLAVAEKKVGHSVGIYCLKQGGALAEEAEAAGIPVTVLDKPARGISLRTLWELAQHLRHDRADVMHTHNPMVQHYAVAAALLAGVKVVVNTRHGLNLVPSDPKAERIYRFCLRWIDRVVAVSQDSLEFFVKQRGIPSEKIQVIINGIPVEKFKQHPAQPGSAWPKVRFGTVARMVPAKDHSTLLQAFALLLQRSPDFELHILGDGPLRQDLERQIVQLGLAASVHLHGASLDVASFLSNLDVFVLSSLTEGLPVSVLEAMAAGLPVVSTRVGGLPEVAPEGIVAWYVPPAQPQALAGVLWDVAQLAPSGRLALIGQESMRRAQAFSIEAMAGSYLRLFRELLA